MAESTPPSHDAPRKRRRLLLRWPTLGELVGIAALTVSALTFWNAYKTRTGAEAERAAAQRAQEAAAGQLLLRGHVERDGRVLVLAPAGSGPTVQEQRVAFPAALGIAEATTLSEPRIEADWVDRALIRARGERETGPGDRRVPVLLTTRFYAGDKLYRDVALKDLGYRIEGGGLLAGRRVRLRGISHVERVAPNRAQARLDALWEARRQ
jgi:hypothetical protein